MNCSKFHAFTDNKVTIYFNSIRRFVLCDKT